MRPTGLGHTALHTRGPPGRLQAVSSQASPAQPPWPHWRYRPAGYELESPPGHPLLPELKGHPQSGFPDVHVKVEGSACPETLERLWGNLCDAQLRGGGHGRSWQRGRGLPGTRTCGPHPATLPSSACGGHADPRGLVQCEVLTAPLTRAATRTRPGHPALSGRLSPLQPRPRSRLLNPDPRAHPRRLPARRPAASPAPAALELGSGGREGKR